jgi:hypothetical protein
MKTLFGLPWMALGVLLVVAGCGGDPSTPQGQCDRETNNDAEVKAAYNLYLATTGAAQADNFSKLNEARRQAHLRCMRANGLAPRGGVEAVKR